VALAEVDDDEWRWSRGEKLLMWSRCRQPSRVAPRNWVGQCTYYLLPRHLLAVITLILETHDYFFSSNF
jgi:hypothetical protein